MSKSVSHREHCQQLGSRNDAISPCKVWVTPEMKLCRPVVLRELVQYSVSNEMSIPADLTAQHEGVRSGEETLAPLTTYGIGLETFDLASMSPESIYTRSPGLY